MENVVLGEFRDFVLNYEENKFGEFGFGFFFGFCSMFHVGLVRRGGS
jgi:translation elongation factor EF-4